MEVTNNVEKQDTYTKIKKQLQIALRNEFYFEAICIEYAIIEDRMASVLKHCNICKDPYNKKLSNKLSSIEMQHGKGHKVISKKIDVKMIADIRKWKEERNDVIHRSCNHMYNKEELGNSFKSVNM